MKKLILVLILTTVTLLTLPCSGFGLLRRRTGFTPC